MNLNILLCSGDTTALKRIVHRFKEAGLNVTPSTNLTDTLCRSGSNYDLLIVDLDGLNSFLRGLLPGVRRLCADLPIIGLFHHQTNCLESMIQEFGLDACLPKSAAPEQILVRVPQVMRYLIHTNYLRMPATNGEPHHPRSATESAELSA